MKHEAEKKEANLIYLSGIYHKGARQGTAACCLYLREQEQQYHQRALKMDIDQILERMPQELAVIIRNDFLEPKSKDWWRNVYDVMLYYRLKNIAINAFFHCLYT